MLPRVRAATSCQMQHLLQIDRLSGCKYSDLSTFFSLGMVCVLRHLVLWLVSGLFLTELVGILLAVSCYQLCLAPTYVS